jgi:methyltransferase-like protein
VYSWVDQSNQIVILNILDKYLAASGLAFIDYNTMPGWHLQNALRGMIQHHVQSYADKQEKIKQAKSFLRFLKDNSTSGKEEKDLLINEITAIERLSDAIFYREFISENNWPVYFSNMVGKLNSFNLAYIADYDLKTMSSQDMPKDAQDALILSPNLIESEQYMDFFRNRRGRKSIICRADAAVYSQSGLDPTKLYDMYLSANNLAISHNVNDLCNSEPLNLNIGGEFSLTVTDPLVKVALKMLNDHSPGQLSYNNLLTSSSECLIIAGYGGKIEEQKEVLAYQLLLLFSCLTARTIDVTANKRNIASYVHHSPKASKLARFMSTSSGLIINQHLCSVNLDENERLILGLLDGSLSYSEIVDAFGGYFGGETVDKSGYVLATLNKLLNYALLLDI